MPLESGPSWRCGTRGGMLTGGAHLSHGPGFLGATDTNRDVVQTLAAFAGTPMLQFEGLL